MVKSCNVASFCSVLAYSVRWQKFSLMCLVNEVNERKEMYVRTWWVNCGCD